MGRQVSQTKEASELGPNAYEVSEEKKDGRKTVSSLVLKLRHILHRYRCY